MISRDDMTLHEAIERLSDRHKPSTKDLASERNEEGTSWDLNTSFSQARALAEGGWTDKADDLWQFVRALSPKVEIGTAMRFDVTGESVDVGRYLSGEPECMISELVTPQSAVKVLVNISAASACDATIMFNRGIALAAIIHALQSSGRGVSLTIVENVTGGRGEHETTVELQRFGDYINPGRLAFWVAHPAALRRCVFRYNEQQSNAVRDQFGFRDGGGYGYPNEMSETARSGDAPEGVVCIPYLKYRDEYEYRTPEIALRTLIELFKKKNIPIEIQGVMSGDSAP
jgi:hypothetical protein